VAEDAATEKDGRNVENELEQCEEKVEELKEENAQLRESAQAFGDLAERLNRQRKAADARSRPHETPVKR
jgi:predicted RNase H-like nuclease (RuvC/YqgF family)